MPETRGNRRGGAASLDVVAFLNVIHSYVEETCRWMFGN